MFSYIILSSVLALIGGLFYFGVLKRFLHLLHAKYALMAIIVLSLCLPVLMPSTPAFVESLEQAYLFDYYAYDEWNVVDINDPELIDCYEGAETSADVCHCEKVQKSEMLAYKPHGIYNIIYWLRQPVGYVFWGLLGLFLIDLIVRLGLLGYLALTKPKEKRRLANTDFYVLYVNESLPISSFGLWAHYVICPPSFHDFSPQEQEAILLHELAHLKQRDTWQQVGLGLAKLVWWMMPMFYLFRKELNALNEYIADTFAVRQLGNSTKYAAVLLKAKEQQLHRQPAYTLGFAKSLLKSRVLRLVHQPNADFPKSRKGFWWALAISTALLWTTNEVVSPVVQEQVVAFKQYEVLRQESDQTGKQIFCKDCLIQKLQANLSAVD